MRTDILQITEKMIRTGGYNSFSFREIAKLIGIKSSSVHYYFPTKECLVATLIKEYTDDFIEKLGNPNKLTDSDNDPIKMYVDAFRKAIMDDNLMCLCGLLGAEIDILPTKVATEINDFFVRNIEWLTKAYNTKIPEKELAHQKSLEVISLLEGAMIVSKSLNNYSLFDQIIALINSDIHINIRP